MRAEDAATAAPGSHGAHSRPLSQVLSELAADTTTDTLRIAELLAALRDRAMAALLLIFALPNVFPMPPGASAILGAPLLLLAAQLMLGRPAWLPAVIASRSMQRAHFAAFVTRAAPWLARAERLLKPRWEWLCRPPCEYAVGAVCLAMAVLVFLPIPLGNMLPALAISLCALGILERDGLWVLAGLVASVASLVLVWGVLQALLHSALFVLARFFG